MTMITKMRKCVDDNDMITTTRRCVDNNENERVCG